MNVDRIMRAFDWLLIAAFLVVAALQPCPAYGQTRVERPVDTVSPVSIQLDAIPTSSLVVMLMRDVMRVPYVIAPDVLSDRRPTSVNLVIPRDRIPEGVISYLRRSGFVAELVGGTVYVSRSNKHSGSAFGGSASGLQNPEALPFGSPLDADLGARRLQYPDFVSSGPGGPVEGRSQSSSPGPGESVNASRPSPQFIVAYLPAHRDTDYFASIVGSVLPGVTFGARSEQRGSAPEGNVSPRLGPDVLVMSGSAEDIGRARKLVSLLDRPRPLVAVKAVVMQVQNIAARGSALSVLASIGGGKLTVGSFAGEPAGSQFVRIAAGGVRAMLTAVREDSRFKVVATPNLAALSGDVATMNSGSQVPTVGAVVVAEGGAPVQSVVYRDSGITLTVRPVVRGDLIELEVREERSTFVRTTTGVEDSPTLQKSSASASVVMKSGESVVLAGLTEASEGQTREGLFGGLLGTRKRDKSDSELLVLVTAELVPSPSVAPGVFLDVGTAGCEPGAAAGAHFDVNSVSPGRARAAAKSQSDVSQCEGDLPDADPLSPAEPGAAAGKRA